MSQVLADNDGLMHSDDEIHTEVLLSGQADRRALNITLNSIGTELTRDDRRKLYSNFGLLYPHGHHELAGAEDFDQIRNAMEKCPPYQALFNKLGYGESQMLDKVRRTRACSHCIAFWLDFCHGVLWGTLRKPSRFCSLESWACLHRLLINGWSGHAYHICVRLTL